VDALAVSGSDLYVGGTFSHTYDGTVTNLNNIAKLSTSAASGPQLTLTKSVIPNIGVPTHGIVTYTVALNNSGTVSDTNGLVTDTLPTGVIFGQWLSAPPGVIQVGNALSWAGTVTDSAAITFTFTATHTGNYGDVIINTAYFSGTSQAGNAAAGFTVFTVAHWIFLPLIIR